MMELFKKLVRENSKRIGVRLLKEESYKKLLRGTAAPDKEHNKNQLLKNLFNLLKEQDFYPETVYDIGANKGTWSLQCMKTFPNAKYYMFEPQTELVSEIHKNLKEHDNYQVFQIGVGNRNAAMDFTIHEREDSCSFLYSSGEAADRGFKQVTIPMVRLEDFVNEKKLKHPSMIKIDAEGLDLEVMEGAGDLLSQTEVIFMEVGVMNKRIPNTVLKVLDTLDSKGFRMFDITDINRPFHSGVLWLCEFVFIKKNGILDKNY